MKKTPIPDSPKTDSPNQQQQIKDRLIKPSILSWVLKVFRKPN